MGSAYIAWYLFLAGAGGGAFFIGAAVDLVLRRWPSSRLANVSPATDAGLFAGPVLVALSSIFLILDLGVPARALNVFTHPAASIIGFGSWAILLFCAFAAASLALGHFGNSRFSRFAECICHCLATVLSLCVVVYSGLFLSAAPAVPFLNTPWIPLLFVASAFATGAAVIALIGCFRAERSRIANALSHLVPFDIALIVVESCALVGFFASTSGLSGVSAHSAMELLTGSLSGTFWLGVAGLGIAIPLIIDTVSLKALRPAAAMAGAGATLAGGLCLRFALLLASARFNLVDMSTLPFWL